MTRGRLIAVALGIVILVSAAVMVALSPLGSGSRESAASTATDTASTYHCPMHPTYVSDAPGDCPICGMRLVPVPEQEAAPAPSTTYHCPMHPTYVSDAPGDCPICGMRLVPAPEQEAAPAPSTTYHCPMHPTYVSDAPGDCPICGMRLVPAVKEEAAADTRAEHRPPQHGGAVPGYVTVSLPAARQQAIGVTTATVDRRLLEARLETVGQVAYDETALAWVSTKIAGWIERLHVDETGRRVERGEPLLEIYSPELVATQEELLLAIANVERLEEAGGLTVAVQQGRALVEAARRRLRLWDISEGQIAALEASRSVVRRFTLFAPVAGHVVEKRALEGQKVMAGESLFRIADLSRVWVLAQIYEQDLPRVRPGVYADIRLASAPGGVLRGRVGFVYPYLDVDTRTMDARVVVPNPGLVLRPGMFADVELDLPSGDPVLAVPNGAVLDTGERRIAFVLAGDGRFEPRSLTLGRRTREFSEVLQGLVEGERVVTSGNFLIDSESRLQAALAGMGGGHRHGS